MSWQACAKMFVLASQDREALLPASLGEKWASCLWQVEARAVSQRVPTWATLTFNFLWSAQHPSVLVSPPYLG